MRVWRISQLHDADKLTGLGGLHVSGRWHHRGQPILYTSATASLAALEVLVHVDPAVAPLDLTLLEIEIPDDVAIESCDTASLTSSWRNYPAPMELQDFGSKWLTELRTVILVVPSAILPIERNYLVNPAHTDAARIRVVQELPFSFDLRLLKR